MCDINNEPAGSDSKSGLSNHTNQECVTISYDADAWRFYWEPLDADLPMFLINGELKDPCESILCYEGVTGKTTMTYTWTDQELDAIGATGKTTTTYTWPGRELDAEIDFLYNRVKGPGPKGRHEESAEGDTSKGD